MWLKWVVACLSRTCSKEVHGAEVHCAPQVTDIEPDPKVRAAMNEINAAQRMREAAMQKAEADKVMVVKRAEASAEAK